MFEVKFGDKPPMENEKQEDASIQEAIQMLESGDTERALQTLKSMAMAQSKEEEGMNKEQPTEAPKKDFRSIMMEKMNNK